MKTARTFYEVVEVLSLTVLAMVAVRKVKKADNYWEVAGVASLAVLAVTVARKIKEADDGWRNIIAQEQEARELQNRSAAITSGLGLEVRS